MLRPMRRALLSVSDKTGLVDFARDLVTWFQVELIATGGTKETLAAAGVPVKDVREFTQFPEILDGRVKTLHPGVFAGLLAKRDKPEHMHTLSEHKLPDIDLVVCNLYPFEDTVCKPGVSEDEIIENIDIGGPSMIRAAAKNCAAVTVVVNPADYTRVLLELRNNKGQTRLFLRRQLAAAAFTRIAEYDKAIQDYFEQYSASSGQLADSGTLTSTFVPVFEKAKPLRYGENPHQQGVFYLESPPATHACVANAQTLHGKELSYNNILDLDAALNLVREFTEPCAVVVKHNNPCGVGTSPKLAHAFQLAWEGDPLCAFGGIVAFNKPVDVETSCEIMAGERFVECIIAPDFEPDALTALKGWKKNVRILKTGTLNRSAAGLEYRRVDGGLLVQSRDVGADNPSKWQGVTKAQATPDQWKALWFAWIVCKHVKSNAIVLANAVPNVTGAYQVVGVGAGQMSRVDSTQIAIRKAGARVKGSVLASDAFFPFRDNVDLAAASGVSAIVQPGGSQRDAESIAACDEKLISMLFTGIRHFRH